MTKNPIPENRCRDEIVKIITDFYTFLTTYPFLPATAIKTPPSDGWPREYRNVWKKMGKSAELIDLMAHLPYIDDKDWEWFPETKPINYLNPLNLRRIDHMWEDKRYIFEPPGDHNHLPDHVISLTVGRLYGKWVLLDVKAGMLIQQNMLMRI